MAPLFSTIIAGVDPLCDTNGHEERTQAAEMQKRRAKIPDPEHAIKNLLNEGIFSATS